jgi:type II secretory ATPase GspE/PulE/Tfp pilus assembly ATPase PilB-like protein
LSLLSPELALRHQVLPIGITSERAIMLAVQEVSDLVALDQVNAHLRRHQIVRTQLMLAVPSELQKELEKSYSKYVSVEAMLAQQERTGREPPVDALLEAMLRQAIDLEASDVHFEPDEFFLRVRLRLDGVLKQVHLVQADWRNKLTVRLKLQAGMNIAESRAAQDGRFSMQFGTHVLDFRVSCLPTAHGENIVLRILDKRKSIVPLKQLELSQETMARIGRILQRPEGMVLVTGPTGSGKTTTLYSMLASISTEGVNVMTLEDPIEYPLPLIRQTQVNDKVTFADGVRALMRQDPDVILVGEIRDQETAEMAFRAAMTGHQVFATLHTNSALAAVQRLRDIGVPTDLIAGNLIGVIGQRLVRRLCKACRAEVAITTQEASWFKGIGLPAPTRLWRAVGCAACGSNGYRGRLLLAEVAVFDEKMDELVAGQSSVPELLRQARQSGFRLMREEALHYISTGETSVDEVSRVVSLVGLG